MRPSGPTRRALAALVSVALLVLAAGCSRHANLVTSPGANGTEARPGQVVPAGGAFPAPAGRVPVTVAGTTTSLFPYTSALLDGVPSDPVNLVFYGAADPIALRNALLALDGDRSSLGYPPAPPFDARWSDAMGDVQATWVDGTGWTGSVIQLALGDFGPVRVHLRLFQVRSPLGTGETWTVGAAHFELLIPGTADHQVLSWERAEQIVAGDLVRSGLLSAEAPVGQTDPINDAPGFRTIPAVIYNGLPPELVAFIEGPPQPVVDDVPIKTDGRATVLHLAGRAPMAGSRAQRFTMMYDQVVPRPLCSSGPYDYVKVTGPVTFAGVASIDAEGNYVFHANYNGKLTGVPLDVTQDPPVPAGPPFSAQVGEEQRGVLGPVASQVSADSRRIVPGPGGSEFTHTFLRVATDGALRSEVDTRCR